MPADDEDLLEVGDDEGSSVARTFSLEDALADADDLSLPEVRDDSERPVSV